MRTALIGIALLATAAGAKEGHREHEAHQHGIGEMNIAVVGEAVQIELLIPAANVVGFEHEPRNQNERAQIAAAKKEFSKPATVVTLPVAAKCTVTDSDVDLGPDEEQGHDKHAHSHDNHEKHKKGHGKHDDHDKHAHGHDKHGHDEHEKGHGKHDEEAHSSLHAEYAFRCKNPKALTEMMFPVFKHLRNAERLDVQLVTDKRQDRVRLTPKQVKISLDGG